MKLASAIYGGGIHPFDTMGFTEFGGVVDPSELDGADALVVWGGEDISPSLYNHAVNRRTGAGDQPSRRDSIEWALMQRAAEMGIPIIGVCRGAQMLCALAGGSLFQHVDGHAGVGQHMATDYKGVIVPVSSLHHQMLNPEGVDHDMVQWSTERRSGRYFTQDNTDPDAIPPVHEPEYVYFPKVKGHAIQWHPEFMDHSCEANNWLRTLWKDRGLSW